MKLTYSTRGLQAKKLIYPAMIIVFFFIAALFFIMTIKFLLASLDRAQNVTEEDVQSQILTVDLNSLQVVATKLAIPIASENAAPEAAPSAGEPFPAATP